MNVGVLEASEHFAVQQWTKPITGRRSGACQDSCLWCLYVGSKLVAIRSQ